MSLFIAALVSLLTLNPDFVLRMDWDNDLEKHSLKGKVKELEYLGSEGATYYFDEDGFCTLMQSGGFRTEYLYHSAGVLKESNSYFGDRVVSQTLYSYDSTQLIVEVKSIDAGKTEPEFWHRYKCNEQGQVIEEESDLFGSTYVCSFLYGEHGQVEEELIEYPNGATAKVLYSYDSEGRRTETIGQSMNAMGGFDLTSKLIKEYNERGLLVKSKDETYFNDQMVNRNSFTEEYLQFDENGNWTESITKFDGDGSQTSQRRIEYYEE